MNKNAFNIILKIWSGRKKPFDQKDMVNFKIYDVTTWLTNSYNMHIGQYLTKKKQQNNEIWSINKM